MNKEALLQLRRVVEEAPDNEFDMGVYQCGSAKCALGHAYYDGWFRENTAIGSCFEQYVFDGRVKLGPKWHYVSLLMQLFDLPCTTIADLFWTGVAFATKKSVVANIDRVIAGQEPIPYGLEHK